MRRSGLLLVLAVGGGLATPLRAQTPPQNVTLRQALQAFDNVDFARAIALARRASAIARAKSTLSYAWSACRRVTFWGGVCARSGVARPPPTASTSSSPLRRMPQLSG